MLSVNEVAKKLGVAPSTLRYYDKQGLLPFQKRTALGVREYSEEDVLWLELICCLKRCGMSLDQIKSFMASCEQGDMHYEERKTILEEHKAYLEKQIQDLQHALCVINFKLDHYKELWEVHKELNKN